MALLPCEWCRASLAVEVAHLLPGARPSPACVNSEEEPWLSHQVRSSSTSLDSGLIWMVLLDTVDSDTPATSKIDDTPVY